MPGMRERVARGRVLRLRCDLTTSSRSSIAAPSSAGGEFPISSRSRASRELEARNDSHAAAADVLADDQHAHSVSARAAVSSRLAARARARAVSAGRRRSEPCARRRIGKRWAARIADSFVYTFTYLAGYLRERAAADETLVLIGDHQPAASVAGVGARWDVPVHVVTRRADVAAALARGGLRRRRRARAAAAADRHAAGAVRAAARDVRRAALRSRVGAHGVDVARRRARAAGRSSSARMPAASSHCALARRCVSPGDQL